MNCSIVCFPFIGDSVGGSQISAVTLIGALDWARYRPLVVLHEPGPLSDYLAGRNIEFEMLPLATYVGSGRTPYGQLCNLAYATPRLWKFLRQRCISIVHTQDGRMNQTWGLAARMAGASFFWHQRSMYAPSRLTYHAMRLANRIICNSEFVRQGLPLSARLDACVIANPFETDVRHLDRFKARDIASQETGLPVDGWTLSFVGNLSAQKRPEVFLHAAALISNRTERPSNFLIFGRDRENLQPRLAALARELGILDSVHFMGFRDPILPWLAASDLLLAPEVEDAFGRTLVEAMLVGTPVIASKSGGHPEIIQSEMTGLLVPPDDASEMATMALSLLAEPDRYRDIALRAKNHVTNRYAVRAHGDKIMEIYDQSPAATA